MKLNVTLLYLLLSSPAAACSGCRPAVMARVFNQDFGFHLLALLLPLAVLTIVYLWLSRSDKGGTHD